MSESVRSCQFSENQVIVAANDIGQAALRNIDQQYGSGHPNWSRGRQDLAYHNGHHGRAVGADSRKLGAAVGLSPVEVAVAEAAGRSHDIVQLTGRGKDEASSGKWLTKNMQERRVFTPRQQEMGRLAIIGTEPTFANNKMVGQKVTELSYPDKRAELVAKSVASADLGELFIPKGPLLSHHLFREIQGGLKPSGNLPMDKIIGFQKHQVHLQENYRYPLKEANSVLATHRRQTAAFTQGILTKLERGDITTWEQLLKADQDFMRRNS